MHIKILGFHNFKRIAHCPSIVDPIGEEQIVKVVGESGQRLKDKIKL
jgi:hypothetical protein